MHGGEGEVADEARVVGAEGQAIAEQHPLQADDAHGGQALHEDREDVLSSDQAPVEEGQTRGHEQHQS